VGLRDRYSIHSNQESGLGRCDVIFIPKDKQKNGIVLEFKTSKTPDLLMNKADEALKQSKDRKYVEKLKQEGINSILAIGLAFCGKQVELAAELIAIEGA